MPIYIFIERNALDPVHQYNGELRLVCCLGVDKQLPVKILDGGEEGAADILQFVGYLAVCLGTALLLLQKALDGIVSAASFVTHLENRGKIAACHYGFAVGVENGAEVT